jgi:hypothetical protein
MLMMMMMMMMMLTHKGHLRTRLVPMHVLLT